MRVSLAASLALAALCAIPLVGFAATTTTTITTTTPPVKTGGITGLDVMTGTVFQEGQSSFSGVAMRLRVRNSKFAPGLEFLPTIEYWQNTSHLDAFDIETRRRDATLGLDMRWMFVGQVVAALRRRGILDALSRRRVAAITRRAPPTAS